jgi:hypothetical protein
MPTFYLLLEEGISPGHLARPTEQGKILGREVSLYDKSGNSIKNLSLEFFSRLTSFLGILWAQTYMISSWPCWDLTPWRKCPLFCFSTLGLQGSLKFLSLEFYWVMFISLSPPPSLVLLSPWNLTLQACLCLSLSVCVSVFLSVSLVSFCLIP